MKIAAWALIAALGATASAQEYWHFGQPHRMYGVYLRRYTAPNVLFSSGNGEQYSKGAVDFNSNSKSSYYDEATAHLEAKVEEVFFSGQPCKRYVTIWQDLPAREDDLRKMDRDQRLKAVMSKTKRTYETVVGPDGSPLLAYSDHTDGYGRIQVWTKFNKDDLDVTIVNKDGTKKLKINPALGVESFLNPIPAMLKAGDKDREPKKFCAIDPKTGGILNYTVRYRTRFTGTFDRNKQAGTVFELETSTGRRLLYVNDKGELLMVDFDNERQFINAVITTDLGKPPLR